MDKILNWLIEQAMKLLRDIYPDAELVIEKISNTEEPSTGYKAILLIIPEPPRYWDVLIVENGIERRGSQSSHWQMAEVVGAMFDAMLSKISLRDFVEFINEAVYGDIL
ncbi:hypothetical protein [Deinococcus sedimenti]|uniref:hypothetical protein n=1 Tax=Deinococcus sedimenti TaxID=1867090 RepID=UPI001662B7BD|nr:hypothetical protein [Deinococcus sedimenti]